MSGMLLILVQGSITVRLPMAAGHGLSQSIEAIEAATLHRMADGSALKQSRWTRRRTTISGDGRTPVAFGRLDFALPMDIWCVMPQAVESLTNIIALPSARRDDCQIWGAADVNGELIRTATSVVGDVATLAAVSGADGYRVLYHPIITCYASRPSESADVHAAEHRWSIEAEEV